VNIGDTILSLRQKFTAAAGATGERLAVELSENRAPIWALADPGQLGEVLAAVIARPAKGVPRERTRIVIAWDVETVAERLSPTPLAPGKYAHITVHDDGPEMDAAQAAVVFEPVLSKSGDPAQAAASSGLALARAYSIVHQWGGDIAFSSEPGQGSTFAIYLPYVEPEKEPGAPPAQRPSAGTATILVVDDESGIRELIRKILLRERYRVLEAGTAEEALTLSQGQSIDLLITDVMLPGIHGPELARRMQQAAPRLKMLFISGFTGEEKVPTGAHLLTKPFTLSALLEKVREALE
jgi:CheY-like chemotaxis protein